MNQIIQDLEGDFDLKFFKISLCSIMIIAVFSLNAFALSSSTYADLSQSSSTVQNLISYANNYSDFITSDYVVFQNGQYSYYIFWGDDFEYDGISVTASEAQCISYIREGSSYDYAYKYTYSDAQNLSLTVNHSVISNIDELGSSSALYLEYKQNNRDTAFNVFILGFLFVLMILAFRRTFKA